MIKDYDEISVKEETIRKLRAQIGEKDRKINQLSNEIDTYSRRAYIAEREHSILKGNLSSLTSERGKWLRKLKRAGIKV